MSSCSWDTEVQLTKPTRGLPRSTVGLVGESREANKVPPSGRWESPCSQRAVGWQSSHITQGSVGKDFHLSVSLSILRFCGRLKLTRSAVPSKNTVSSHLDKTNLCHLSIFATEIPDFTQLSLEFYNLATYDCNLSLHAHTHGYVCFLFPLLFPSL